MNTIQKPHWITGALLILAGGAVFLAAYFWRSKWQETITAFVGIVGAVMFLWGIVDIAWMFEKSLRGIGAPLMLLIGFFIMIAAAVSGALIFAVVGGFMAVIGGMFLL